MTVKLVKIKGEQRYITIDQFNLLVENNIPFEDLGNKDI